MAWPLVQIVDNLDQSNVLFDFNPGRTSELQRWFTKQEASPLGEPTWDTSAVGVVEGSRTLKLPLRFTGRQAEPAMAVLSEILTRTVPVYLQFQHRADAAPVWFRLRRQTAGGSPDFTMMFPGDVDNSMWQWTVDLVADAFALGARVDLDPTALLAKAGQSFMAPVEIPEIIEGSAPAPLNVELDCGDLSKYTTELVAWSANPGATVEPWGGVATLSQTLDTNQFMYVDPGQLPNQVPPGMYRPMAYLTRTSTSGSCKLHASIIPPWGTDTINAPAVTISPGTGTFDGQWVDLGRLTLPPGMNYIDMAEGDLPADMGLRVVFNGDGTTGASWTITKFMLAPLDTVVSRSGSTALRVGWGQYPSSGAAMRIDSERSRVGLVDTSTGGWMIGSPPLVGGAFPRVQPGARNFLMFLPRTNSAPKHDYGTGGTASMWYYPRHLHVGAR